MQDLKGAEYNKDKIIATIKWKGPSLPVQISKVTGLSPLFASAFLSELKAQGRLKISDMRVGSSPLYYLEGQEEMLENFQEHLNQREREAFLLLKERKFLEDEKQEPVVRVALRAIKDFAIPIKVRIDGESKLFWKYFSLSEEDFVKLLQSEKKIIKAKSESKAQDKLKKEIKTENKAEFKEEKITQKSKKIQESEFSKKVKNYLIGKDIEVTEVFLEKKKEFEGRVRIDTIFGKQEYYLVAKDKKSFTENDLSLALQKAQSAKLPALSMGLGELNKKGKEYLRDWGNLLKWEKLNF